MNLLRRNVHRKEQGIYLALLSRMSHLNFLSTWNLPGGQKHPSMQCSSHIWLLLGLLQVSVQGLSHSLYTMLKGHVLAMQRIHTQKNIIFFYLETIILM